MEARVSPSSAMALINHLPTLHLLIILLTITGSILPSIVLSNESHDSLVYKSCSNHTFQGSKESYSQLLSSIFQELASHSPRSKFFKTNNKGYNQTFGISAFYQCRGDLSNYECHNCVRKFADGTTNAAWCEEPAVAGRVQLAGCYLHYETDEFTAANEGDHVTSNHVLLQRICDWSAAGPAGFQGVRDAALLQLETEMAGSSNNGFYEGNFDYVHVMGQCEAGMGACDCAGCVSVAAQVVNEECGSSASGQVYLDQCFLSYKYDPDGMSTSSSQEQGNNGGNSNTGRTVAIVVGGGAALFAIFMFLQYVQARRKKVGAW